MNAVLVLLGLALLFYFMHRTHGQVGGCHDRPARGADAHGARAAEEAPDARGAPPGDKDPWRPGLVPVLLVALILLAPLILLHGVIPPGSAVHPLLFRAALLLPILLFPVVRSMGQSRSHEEVMAGLEAEQEAREAEWRRRRLEVVGPLGERTSREMEIEATRYERDLVIFEGRLRRDAEGAYGRLARSFAEVGRSPRLLEAEGGRAEVVAMPIAPGEAEPVRQGLTVPLLLFAATFFTTTWAGALHQACSMSRNPGETGRPSPSRCSTPTRLPLSS